MAQPKLLQKPFNRTSPAWAGTPQHQPKVLLPGGGFLNAAAFTSSSDAIVITVGSGGAAAAATSVPIAALTDNNANTAAGAILIPAGAIVDFTGSGKFARLTAAAAKGATTLTVEALPQALVAGDVATYKSDGSLYVRSGTLVGRTFAERDANVGFGPADVATPDDEIFLLYFDVANVLDDNECELYMSGAGNVVYENFVPDWASLSTPVKTAIRSRYVVIKAQP